MPNIAVFWAGKIAQMPKYQNRWIEKYLKYIFASNSKMIDAN
jgi:hypothetical protein